MTLAACLDAGTATLNSVYDASHPIQIGGFTIHDFHAMNRPLNVRQIFIHSSNIGAAKMAVQLGVPRHKAFLKKMGLLSSMTTELGPTADPLYPKDWRKINTMTIAFGHGISVAPLQFAAAAIPVVNGGIAIKPTFLPRTRAQGMASGHRVLKESTSRDMVELMRDNVLEGTGRQAQAPGYRVGGKTGTADKVINGRYSNSEVRNSFLATFPTDDPQYVVFVMLDQPKKVKATRFLRTAGANAAPTVGRIIARIGPILGVEPKLGADMHPFKGPPPKFDDEMMASY
jgi:cell division protein FtsI (penicillin-binding protein 3)